MLVAVVGLLTVFAPTIDAQIDVDFVVVVNPSNPVESLTRDQLSRLFLKEQETWPDGRPVEPIELSPESEIRRSFSREIHGRSVKAIEAFWHRQVFQGTAVPPVTSTSETDVVFFVRSNRNGIGYVSPAAIHGTGLKVITVLD